MLKLGKLLNVYPTNIYWYKYMFSTTLVIVDISVNKWNKSPIHIVLMFQWGICYDHLILQRRELKPREVKWLAHLSWSPAVSGRRWRTPASWFLLHWSFVCIHTLLGLNCCISSQDLPCHRPWRVRNKFWFLRSLPFLKLVKLNSVLGREWSYPLWQVAHPP